MLPRSEVCERKKVDKAVSVLEREAVLRVVDEPTSDQRPKLLEHRCDIRRKADIRVAIEPQS